MHSSVARGEPCAGGWSTNDSLLAVERRSVWYGKLNALMAARRSYRSGPMSSTSSTAVNGTAAAEKAAPLSTVHVPNYASFPSRQIIVRIRPARRAVIST